MTPRSGIESDSRPDAGSTFDYRVRFDEAAPDGRVRPSVLLRYAQDVAWLDSDRHGFDRAWYRERGLAWVVRAIEMEISGPIELGQTIRIATRVIGQRKVWARRRANVEALDGRPLAWLHTDWVLIDERGRLVRVPEIFAETFKVPAATFDLGRVTLNPTPVEALRGTVVVRPHELDPLGHVNNAAYVDWLEESLPQDGGRVLPRHWQLEYASAAGAGETLTAESWPDGTGWSHRLVRASDGAELFRARVR